MVNVVAVAVENWLFIDVNLPAVVALLIDIPSPRRIVWAGHYSNSCCSMKSCNASFWNIVHILYLVQIC
jgi:hypothetical protein